jgi:hypothetical protein
MAVANTLAFYRMATITAVISFIVQEIRYSENLVMPKIMLGLAVL